ncbi:ABC transporter permease [Vibrio astriarenae]|uniref:ABC transporter permease n=1 Tax=Vibrio astriarenae TaxID=1481923 RepID=UPI0037362D8E
MQNALDISVLNLFAFSLLMLIPLSINAYFKLSLAKDMLLGVVRMAVQLALIGIYLEYLFELDSWIVNLGWLLVMMLIAASSVVSKSRLPKSLLLLPVFSGLFFGLLPILLVVCIAVVQPQPFYSAQYVIPLSGMLLGNSLSGNIVALQNFFGSFDARQEEYAGKISLGASPIYASRPFVEVALQKSLAPILATMATMGLVSLPGMMTGQILSGTSPIIAIKYQLLIMMAIFVMMNISITSCLLLTQRRVLSPEGRLLCKIRDK